MKTKKPNQASLAMNKLRTKKLSPARRKEIAQKAIKARWDKAKKED